MEIKLEGTAPSPAEKYKILLKAEGSLTSPMPSGSTDEGYVLSIKEMCIRDSIFTAEQEWEFCHLYDYDVSFRKVRDVLSKESPGEEDAEPEKGQKDAPNLHI